jgi:hypothetical protein
MSTHRSKTGISNSTKIIDRISSNYSSLQKKYRDWAAGFKSYKEVSNWLKKEKIPGKISKNQKNEFYLLSSDWNPITISVLYKKAYNTICQLKREFDDLSNNLGKDDLVWYLVYFIHPVLHELYYFNDHFTDGYHSRLPNFLRFHRLGLKSVKTYLKNKSNTVHDSFMKACGTTMFKFIHLHPTVSARKKPNLNNLEKGIRNLKIGEKLLSSDELAIAMTLSAKANIIFEKWIEYAPCAINEGPIFILKKGRSNLDCFREIIKTLQSDNPTQNVIRGTLKKYYEIEE